MKIGGTYKNGQLQSELKGDKLTVYFKTGIVKAEGRYISDKMDGKWRFYRQDGKLWQIGNFSDGLQHGEWIRYDRNGKKEYHVEFDKGKISRKIL